ncbi:MAG: Protein phosphatase 2C-like protein [Candidatus Uhrbacteria bacterium GW2011_GWD2_41_121]|uniref:Phosphoric monoester hydrolase, protein phosphatase n=1 Tax=Candidatus Uhrbacteria bacterium GW2011_GWC1_41_20 TaxID=1618983 RepID=A0A0G0V9I0_9BACT|nr:MAG: Protein phosphatase 2C-like protein [Candidatus Uhrbacteria bacterium GW2011_GWE1_39_46]KKR63342.1 MAG: Protein phosphatase 2C-like protein [Candidatus Uhrbacteria bacterium GW2011_GWC2_40_450]KKR89603.1 MAG: Protein phosphatase 2C-like protein [Candidatus Uhrbacteria bacterium GW2011_GWD2_41_121]KKR95094.1 MAG: Protein phosphatase 2C-like protein [Candidatus Uhrbacteria bacterium GW2011_GWD1_41_16]KKR97604.1 MAG: phosphoric monoester hydrolase, protein phosphatase [Candidatus Uhrbacter
MKLDFAAISDPGDRSYQQDLAVMLFPAMIFGVIDGMGGHKNGDKAAQLVLKEYEYLQHEDKASMEPLLAAAKRAHAAVYAINKDKRGCERAGAVGTIGWINQRYCRAHIVHIGDSRVYLFGQKGLQQISVDDTPLAGMNEKDRLNHEKKNQIYDAYGLHEHANFSTYEIWFNPGETLMFCTDGLSDLLLPINIQKALARNDSALEIARDLLQMAKCLPRPCKDNITIVVVRAIDQPSDTQNSLGTNPTCCPIE